MPNILTWLADNGLDKYAQTFRDHDIDFDVLAEISESDLAEFGVSFGDRKRMMRAIRALSESDQTPEQPASASALGNETATGGEHRQLTVLFCDLVGSTELAERVDAEDLRELNTTYQGLATRVIEHHGGYVARYMGDGVLAYFGYPRADEDDAQQAVRAGLALSREVPVMPVPRADIIPAVRVGVATGPVIVGDIIGAGAARESAAVGQTPNLAARLQALAPSGGVLLAPTTKELAGARFKYDDLGLHALKGISEPVHVHAALGEHVVESRFDASHGARLTSFVGRGPESALLLERWETARRGEGQLVLLSGEAGIGKSRIVKTLCDAIGETAHARLRYQCASHAANSALYPIISQLEFAARILPSDTDAVKSEKLEGLARLAGPPDTDTLAALAALLEICVPDGDALATLSPQARKQRIFDAMLEQVQGLAAKQPLLIVFEDVHWSDPTSTEFLGSVADLIADLPVLLIITFRSEFVPPWGGQAHATALRLARLTRTQSEALALEVAGGKPLPDEVLRQVVAKTDGIPLFVEELTKDLVESGLLRTTGARYELAGPLPALAIPSSLHDSLMARLDRLAAVKQVAQIGATIGREFPFTLLQAVCDMPPDALAAALAQLVDAELVFQRGEIPDASYTFKHALVQDAAYQSLLRATRQQLHARIAQAIEQQRPHQVRTQPELLARHYAAAGLAEEALEYWQAAAEQAIARSAYYEAIVSIDEALGQLEQLPQGSARERRELALQVAKLGPLLPVKGYAGLECEATAARAIELYRSVGEDPEMLFAALYVRWVGMYVTGQHDAAHMLSAEFLEHAEAAHSGAPIVIGNRLRAVTYLMRGDPHMASQHAQRALDLYDADRYGPLVARYGQDLKVQAYNYAAISEALLGNVDAATSLAREGLAHTRSIGHLNTLLYGLWHLGIWFAAVMRDSATLAHTLPEMLELTRTHKIPFWELTALPYVISQASVSVDDIRAAENAVDGFRQRFNMQYTVPENYCRISEAYFDAGMTNDARRVLTSAREVMSLTGELYWEAELCRVEGRLELANGRTAKDDAIGLFEQAIAVARRRKTGLLELRATTSLVHALAEAGERAEARNRLTPVLERFADASTAHADVSDARTLLSSL